MIIFFFFLPFFVPIQDGFIKNPYGYDELYNILSDLYLLNKNRFFDGSYKKIVTKSFSILESSLIELFELETHTPFTSNTEQKIEDVLYKKNLIFTKPYNDFIDIRKCAGILNKPNDQFPKVYKKHIHNYNNYTNNNETLSYEESVEAFYNYYVCKYAMFSIELIGLKEFNEQEDKLAHKKIEYLELISNILSRKQGLHFVLPYNDESRIVERYHVTKLRSDAYNFDKAKKEEELALRKKIECEVLEATQNKQDELAAKEQELEKKAAELDEKGSIFDRLASIEAVTKAIKVDTSLLPNINNSIEDLKGYLIDFTNGILDVQKKYEDELRQLSLNVLDNSDKLEKVYASIINESASIVLQENDKFSQNFKYAEIEKEIANSFGNAWEKLERRSKIWIVQSQYLFHLFSKELNTKDYSVVCHCACKALENELNIRFYSKYIEYLKEKYPLTDENNINLYPSVLVKIEKGKKIFVSQEDITLGSIPYLCDSIHDKNDKDYLNKKCIICYAKDRLLIDNKKSDDEIYQIVRSQIGSQVQSIADKWRNKSAHPNQIDRNNAKNCLDFLILVQKKLKEMLDLFNY